MEPFNSRYRLRSSAFERPEEKNQLEPKKVIFLSVEGDDTERNYFTHLGSMLDSSVVHIEVLRHRKGDGYVDPTYVIGLLQEYLDMRQGSLIPPKILNQMITMYSKETIQTWLSAPDQLSRKLKNRIRSDLLLLGIDVEYRRYLQSYNHGSDIFGVILDRDRSCHSRKVMENSVEYCQKQGFLCCVSNPCFEFWLLLHLCDVKAEFGEEERSQMLLNPKQSKAHTKVSHEVSKRADHRKKISMKTFREKYFPNIETAIRRSKDFASDFPELYDNLGTNIPELLEKIGFSTT